MTAWSWRAITITATWTSTSDRRSWREPIATCGTLGVSIILAACASQRAVAADRPAAQLAALCASCHRLDNRPHGIAPIATLGERQIIAMMRRFKAHRHSGSFMHVVSNGLSDAEIVAVAGYLSGASGKTER